MNLLNNVEERQLGNLELLARQVVEGFIIGLHKSPFHGFSVEFAEHRLYNPGESTRNLDWKVFARTDKLFVKRFEEETNLRCQLVIDASSSMYFPEKAKNQKKLYLNKIRFSALAASALMNLLQRQRDAFGLSVFAESLQQHTPCKSSTTHYRLLLSYLDQLIQLPERNKQTAAAESLHQIAESIHKRSMVIIFSDMMDSGADSDELFRALQHLKHNKHEVILFHVVDQAKEMELAFDNRPYLFVDMETGEKVRLQSNQIKDQYVAQMKAFKDALRLKCMQYKIDFVEADINKGVNPILQSFLVKRSKMRI
ncbi:MAG: DUF58 domain-containing protein [Saprospiraceae bacterium]|jgi:uncharacterized protein (DUF58 family)|nr:DUF58 domain-containing protein [Saprospiraceae bacterium]MDP4998325.1 DUF58 domain-containing protein [Saprospiraceae bacterium]